MELSWIVQWPGQSLSPARCTNVGDTIAEVSLCARACTVIRDGACVGDVTCPVETWACDRFRGTTRFSVGAGRKELWIDVRCAGGGAATVQVPAPVVRDVADGEVTQLDAILITVPASSRACPTS